MNTKNFTDRIKIFILMAGMVISLAWPAIYNGSAFFFPDTSAYLRAAGTAIAVSTNIENSWSDESERFSIAQNENGGSGLEHVESEAQSEDANHPVMIGRSIYYGFLILPPLEFFGGIGASLLQASLVVYSIWLFCGTLGYQAVHRAVFASFLTGICAILTPLPLFTSMLMPDIFVGVAVLCLIAALSGWDRLRTIDRVGLVALLFSSVTFHSSILLLTAVMALLALILRPFVRHLQTAGIVLAFAAVTVGMAAEIVFIRAVQIYANEEPVRPPFLSARLIDMGPGYKFLRRECPGVDFQLCDFLDRMPRDSDTFLWSENKMDGVFSAEDFDVQRQVGKEDTRFAVAVLTSYPVEVILGGLALGAKQMTMFEADIFNIPASEVPADNLPKKFALEVEQSPSASRNFPVEFYNQTALWSLAFAVLILGWAFLATSSPKQRLVIALFFAAVSANAMISGGLSKPHNRYNARLIWVIHFAAAAVVIQSHFRNRDQEYAKDGAEGGSPSALL